MVLLFSEVIIITQIIRPLGEKDKTWTCPLLDIVQPVMKAYVDRVQGRRNLIVGEIGKEGLGLEVGLNKEILNWEHTKFSVY